MSGADGARRCRGGAIVDADAWKSRGAGSRRVPRRSVASKATVVAAASRTDHRRRRRCPVCAGRLRAALRGRPGRGRRRWSAIWSITAAPVVIVALGQRGDEGCSKILGSRRAKAAQDRTSARQRTKQVHEVRPGSGRGRAGPRMDKASGPVIRGARSVGHAAAGLGFGVVVAAVDRVGPIGDQVLALSGR